MVAVQEETKPELVVRYRERTAQFFIEDSLSLTAEQTSLEMVLIPAGEFLMGSPEYEQGRDVYGRWNESFKDMDVEGPQHLVTVPSFFIGKYPVTQAQWRAVAALPQVAQALDPDPAEFKGDNRPVEKVSWFDAVEFCARLKQHAGRPYRLPSEAEWEYACRAGTTTPFHFGASITTDLANYCGTDFEHEGKIFSGAYGGGPHGVYRQETTPVGSFDVANAFGLYDMHGNVWEWCLDHWHDNYEGAPNDGRAWIDSGESKTKDSDNNKMRGLRGGSWYLNPEGCRSAIRNDFGPGNRGSYVGFRVVCVLART